MNIDDLRNNRYLILYEGSEGTMVYAAETFSELQELVNDGCTMENAVVVHVDEVWVPKTVTKVTLEPLLWEEE